MPKKKKQKKSHEKNVSQYEKRSGDKFSVEGYKNRIVTFVQKSGKKPVSPKDLATKCRSVRGNEANFNLAVNELIEDGVICQRKRGFVMCSVLGFFKAEIVRLNRTFGFMKRCDTEEEIFVPGKFLCGAMPKDIVLAHYIPSRSEKPEGEVLDILKTADSKLTGIIIEDEGEKFFLADTMSKTPVRIENGDIDYKIGDKVMAEICRNGRRHRDHKVKILFTFGSAQSAECCAKAMLAVNDIETEFNEDVKREAKRIAASGVWPDDFKNRLDLRNLPIFTIDSAESKDLDDAVSIEKTDNGYILGVHIADVSHYVKGNSPLDKSALERGTSIYYADQVIPMLPKELSNGICSLNPDEDRLTFSAIMNITSDGMLKDFKFAKSVIRSRVKGIYSEINTILDNTATDEIKQKYEDLIPSINIMNELADIRIENRKKRGAPEIETTESKIILNDDHICVDIKPRTRGKSEMIIEEFMLLANESAAKLAAEKEIPFVYRIHEQPATEKIDTLKESLQRLNVEIPVFSSVKPTHIAQILENAKGKDCYPVVNMITLRSMAKAKYETDPIGHFGLALDDYAHFTSPIRRYPDLAIHRILSDVIDNADSEWLEKRYSGFAQKASEHSTAMEIRAANIERECEDCYKAEYMQNHIGDEFEGIISSVTDFGFYVELDNTIEGLVHINTLPEGYYEYDGYFSIKDEYSDRCFMAGNRVKIICSKADVNSGKIDFELA
ncbi:MAG: ribonuclease R [Oscillospiraceae bacterium]|nr:ribonuclease R [Oscillospiraceae bacterium]